MIARRIGLFAALAAVSAAWASPVNYAQRATTVRAGVLLIESQVTAGVPSNLAPHVWFVLDANRSVKPSGWTFSSPRAQTVVTPEIFSRWNILSPGSVPAPGTILTKRAAPYWEIRLRDSSDEQLADYDVLLLRLDGGVQLTPFERERLRRFVDQGGVLWMDVARGAAPMVDLWNQPPIPFQRTSVVNNNGIGVDFTNPLLSGPAAITQGMIEGLIPRGGTVTAIGPWSSGPLSPLVALVPAEGVRLDPGLWLANPGEPAVAATATIGDGIVVLTGLGLSQLINQVATPSGFAANLGFFSVEPASDPIADTAARIVVNAIAAVNGSGHAASGARRPSSVPFGLRAPLLRRFAFNAGANETTPVAKTVTYRGLGIAVVGGEVIAFDLNPSRDIDRDGNPDDGEVDLSNGAPYDIVWRSLPGGADGEVVALSVPNAGPGISRDQVLVQVGGRVTAYNPFTLTGQRRISPLPNVEYTLTLPGGGTESFAPVAHEGLVYIGTNVSGPGRDVGYVAVIDPATGTFVDRGTGRWEFGGPGQDFLGELSGPPSVAYIPIQDNSGGQDKVMYIPTEPISTGGPGPNGTAGITSVWLGARGERPAVTQVDPTTGNLIVTTRASLQGLPVWLSGPTSDPLGIRLTVLDANGVPLAPATMNAIFSGSITQTGGLLEFGVNTGQSLPAGFSVRIDYSIDLGTGQPSLTGQLIRGQLFFPDDNNRQRRVLGALAVSPTGTVHAVVGRGLNLNTPGAPPAEVQGDSYYAVREEGRGTFRMLNRYTLFPDHQVSLNQAAPQGVRTLFADNDGVTSLVPILAGPFTFYSMQGSPVIRGDTVFVNATGRKSGGAPFAGFIPFTIVMAFKADPPAAEIETPDLGDGFSLLQPDITRSGNKTAPDQFNVLQPGQFVYERQRGAATGRIRLDNLMSSNRGPVQNAFSLSQPVIVRRPGQPDLFIDPGIESRNWSPLRWYVVLHGVSNQSSMAAAGDELYIPGASSLPSLLSGLPPTVSQGVLTGIDTRVAPNDPFLVPDPQRPWQRQLMRLQTAPFRGNPAFIWPQNAGLTSFEDFRVRLLQTAIPETNRLNSLAVGEGALVATSSDGVFGYGRADFIVADQGRLARFDSSGNPVWTSDTTSNPGASDLGNSGAMRGLVQPTRAYPVGPTDFLVSDPGANRIVRVAQTGRELRSIREFELMPGFVPVGFKTTDPLTLSSPRDAVTWTSYQENPAVPGGLALEFWRHYLIADTGNRRLVEVIDRFGANPATGTVGDPVVVGGRVQTGVLLWTTPGSLAGGRFAYTSVARVDVGTGATPRYLYVAAVGNAVPARAEMGLDNPGTVRAAQDGNGGVIVFDPLNPAATVVANEFNIPDIPGGVFWRDNLNGFDPTPQPARTQRIGSVNSVSARLINGLLAIMVTDSSGVYEIVPNAGGTWDVRWMINREAYRVLRGIIAPRTGPATGVPNSSNPRDFRPLYARRLDSGEVLIVNGYVGDTRGDFNPATLQFANRRQFNGEIVQLEGAVDPTNDNSVTGFGFGKTNLGFGSSAIRFELPPVQGARGIVLPVFADRN